MVIITINSFETGTRSPHNFHTTHIVKNGNEEKSIVICGP